MAFQLRWLATAHAAISKWGPGGKRSGQLKADSHCRAIQADGTVHPALFLLGPSVSGSAGSSGFSRPYFNGPGFRQNDAVARHLLSLLAPTVRKEERHAS